MTRPTDDPRITPELLRELFTYDAETGDIRNRVRRSQAPAGALAGTVGRRGYRVINLFGVPRFAHRLVWLMVTGAWPAGEVDHINRDKGDNRWVNLRDVPKSDNVANAGLRRDNKSGARGVHSFRGRWKAEVVVRGTRYHLGVFDLRDDAALAHDQAEVLLRSASAAPAPAALRAQLASLAPQGGEG